ncbi:hypothetical protein Acr_00g0067180 [Actinidia rufa]|uniref:Uncharacterized protein n=1 Tax=Actinidia rufa TaxID=165716 RepID=A0A7J0DQU9_9ERIC|nr:hypothetical protein Acr_00g0067180 [Actinidia rufa]
MSHEHYWTAINRKSKQPNLILATQWHQSQRESVQKGPTKQAPEPIFIKAATLRPKPSSLVKLDVFAKLRIALPLMVDIDGDLGPRLFANRTVGDGGYGDNDLADGG